MRGSTGSVLQYCNGFQCFVVVWYHKLRYVRCCASAQYAGCCSKSEVVCVVHCGQQRFLPVLALADQVMG